MVVASAGWEMTIWTGWATPAEAVTSRKSAARHGTKRAEAIWRQCTAADGWLATVRPGASHPLAEASAVGYSQTPFALGPRPQRPADRPLTEAFMSNAPVASYSLIVRIRIVNTPGMLGKVTSAIGAEGGDIGAIDIVEVGREVTRDISFKASDEAHGQRITERIRGIEGVTVVHVSDRTFLMHLGGKIQVNGRVAVKTRDDLSMAYTPGVARVCMAIH